MGLLTNYGLAPVTIPGRGLLYILREIQKAVEHELNDPDKIRMELLERQRQLDAGVIDEATYDAIEEELLSRLQAINEQEQQRS